MFLEVLDARFRYLSHIVAHVIVAAGLGFRISNPFLNSAQSALMVESRSEQGFNQLIFAAKIAKLPQVLRGSR